MMADRTTDRSPASDRRLDELAFLHEIAQLATLARDWDELMRSIVDGTTVAMGVEVCSFYLADHEKTRLTLAATNGLDRTQVGTGQPRLGRGDHRPRRRDARADRGRGRHRRTTRFSWVRGFDIEGLTAMLSVPLVWHDGVVGVLNVQTRGATPVQRRRDRVPPDDRRAAGGHRREGPPDGRGRGPAGRS